VTSICHSMITSAFGAITKLFTAFVCHAFLGKAVTISTRKGSSILGAIIYDEIIKFCFSYTIIK